MLPWPADRLPELRAALERLSMPEPNSGCWIWLGSARDYGSFNMLGKSVRAHRAAHLLFVGPIAPGLVVMHKCDNKLCVNPAHLRAGTQRENLLDFYSKRTAGDYANRGLKNPTGANFAQRKLKASDVDFIRSSPLSARALADIFGVHHTAVSYARRGVTFKDATTAPRRQLDHKRGRKVDASGLREKVSALRANGCSFRAIAKTLGISVGMSHKLARPL